MTRTSALVAICLAAAVPVFAQAPQATVSVVASGLNDPRGLAFGPDDYLYIAEAGTGDGGSDLSTIGQCAQVAPPVGPFTAGYTARISRVSLRGGAVETVRDRLPSSEASPLVGGDRQGVSAVTFIGNQLLALFSGAGCSHGHAANNNGVARLDSQGRWSTVADLSAWILANPGAKGAEVPLSSDYEPDGVWYSLAWDQGRLYALEPNHGLLVSMSPQGEIDLERDLFATFGDHTYSAMTSIGGEQFVGTLGQIAFGPNGPDLAASFHGKVYRLTRNGGAEEFASNLRAVLGLAVDRQRRLYAIQSPIFVPQTGSLVRVSASGQHQTIVSGLTFPSSVVTGPDGALYVAVCGYHCSPGQGQILRVVPGD
jgi:hypothetical protein